MSRTKIITMIPVIIRRKLTSTKALLFVIVCIICMISLGYYLHDVPLSAQLEAKHRKDLMNRWHVASVKGFLSLREVPPVSKLGGILFEWENIPEPNPNANRTFVVLVWKYWDWLKRRHVFNFGKPGYEDNENELLENCSVKNCIFSGDDNLIDTADAVLVHLQRGLVPQVKNRNRTQRWIFLNDESPRNAFSLAQHKPSLDSLYNIFNWSMTYRTDADVPVPYGRVVPLDKPVLAEYKSLQDLVEIIPNWKRKNRRGGIAAVLMSNCGAKARNEFLEKLSKHVTIDVYGRCSKQEIYKTRCPGHFKSDCDPIAGYLFYLVLENTSCFQYLTEKVFYHAYAKGAIPVIFGPILEDVQSLLPPNSYLYADAETNIESLAKDMNTLATSGDLIISMHMWRNHYKIVNEHGYFGTKSYHLCRVCEALNYNDNREKIYDKKLLDFFLDPSRACY